jgi:hypothetical protein
MSLSLSFTADPNRFTISPQALTLQKSETSALVSITTVDNQFAEFDNFSVTVSADSAFGTASIPITITDDEGEYILKCWQVHQHLSCLLRNFVGF